VAGDFNPLLVDETYARTTSFGGPVLPGSMIAAVAVGLGSLDAPIPATAGMVGMSWRFLKPVRPGDSIQARWRLNRKRAVENPSLGLVFWQVDVVNQDGHVVATGEVGRLVQRREVAVAAAEPEKAGRRRRRRRAGAVEKVAEAEEGKPPPEPATADVPTPSRRRRRRRGNGGAANGASETRPGPDAAAPAAEPIEPIAAAAAAASATGIGLRGVLRRLRGG